VKDQAIEGIWWDHLVFTTLVAGITIALHLLKDAEHQKQDIGFLQ
jgi:hypothetical protein